MERIGSILEYFLKPFKRNVSAEDSTKVNETDVSPTDTTTKDVDVDVDTKNETKDKIRHEVEKSVESIVDKLCETYSGRHQEISNEEISQEISYDEISRKIVDDALKSVLEELQTRPKSPPTPPPLPNFSAAATRNIKSSV